MIINRVGTRAKQNVNIVLIKNRVGTRNEQNVNIALNRNRAGKQNDHENNNDQELFDNCHYWPFERLGQEPNRNYKN